MYLSVPIDPFDILLHKHGGLPEEDKTSPIDLLRDISKRTDKKQEDTSLAVHLFKDNVCRHCGLKKV
jgi:hypothetical protein